jgi:hypothetical protein
VKELGTCRELEEVLEDLWLCLLEVHLEDRLGLLLCARVDDDIKQVLVGDLEKALGE